MSLFHNLEGLGFTDNEINAVNEWRDVLRATGPIEQAIEKNCQLETRVNDDIRAKFLRNILKRFAETGNPRDAIQNAVAKNLNNPDPLLLKGPEVRINLPDRFGRLVTYDSIIHFCESDGAEAVDESMDEYELPSKDDVELGQTIAPRKLPNKFYSNRYGFLWATDADLINPGLGIDELRCCLGLLYEEGILLLKIVYQRNLVHGNRCLFPTVVEGREFPAFQPANFGADVGYTRHLRDNSAQCPEWVHGDIPMHQVEHIGPAVKGNSRVPNGPVPDGYLKEKLS